MIGNESHSAEVSFSGISDPSIGDHATVRRVLVTGATGYIGAELIRKLALRRSGVCVVAGTRRDAVPYPGVATLNLGDLAAESDIQPDTLASFDSIVHTAALAHGRAVASANVRLVNVEATLKLATAAAEAGVRRFVFLSTAGVMGPTTAGRPVTESDHPRPVGPYATSKLEAERGLVEISNKSKMDVVIVRPPTVHGPDAPGTLRRLTAALRKGVPLPLYGICNQRSFLAIENLVHFLAVCIEHPAAAGRTFFVSDGKAVSTTEFVLWLAMNIRSRSRLFFVPESFARSASRLVGGYRLYQSLWGDFHVDDKEARQRLGWRPVLRSSDGVCDLQGVVCE